MAVDPINNEIRYITNTALFWPNPIWSNLWWKWPLSAPKIGFLFKALLIIAKTVSKIGSPSASTGIISVIAVVPFNVPSIDMAARTNPKKYAPVSPIKILAGLKLWGKNPKLEPANIIDKTATGILPVE